MNLGALLSSVAAQNPNLTALICGDDKISYSHLEEMTTALAEWMIDQGCNAGDRVGLYWPNSIEMAQLLFACFKVGLIAVPINMSLKAPEVAYILAHSKAVLCFTPPKQHEVVKEAARECSWLGATHTSIVAKAGKNNPPLRPQQLRDDDPALILYTSGSTGRPKGVTHSHATALEIGRLVNGTVPGGIETSLLLTQMTYVTGICGCLIPTIAGAGTVVIAPEFNASLVLDLIETHRCTYIIGLPSMAQLMAEEQLAKPRQVSSLHVFVGVGDSVPPHVQEVFRVQLGIPLREGYGMTEAAPLIVNPADDIRPGSLGKAVSGVEVRLVDSQGRDVPAGSSGEIIARSPAAFTGYWDDPSATRETLRDGWLYTGDLARRDGDGYFWFEGRKKNIIVRGGYNISPQEVEEAFVDHPAVREVAVIGEPVEVYGERVIAFVVLRDGFIGDETELISYAAKRLANIKTPERILFMNGLPKGSTGKIQRRALKERERISS